MIQNDFLNPLFSLSPFVVALVILFWGFGTLALVAIRTKTVGSVLLANPAFIGDLLLLPCAGFLIAYFYRAVVHPVDIVTSPIWNYGVGFLALLLAAISVVRSDMISIWGVPHLTFYCFFAYIAISFVCKGLLQLILGTNEKFLWLVWVGVLILTSTHVILGLVFPKVFLPCPPKDTTL
jgi:hypothetical protein